VARNGSGTYSLPQAPFVTNTTISSTATNSNNSDIAAALTQSISKDGQTTYTGNQPMGANKLTGLGAGTAATDSVNMSQLVSGAANYALASGTDTITITPSPGITAYAIGQRFVIKIANTNTGAVTLNVNSVGAGAVTWPNGTALSAGDLPANAMIEVDVQATTPVFHLQTVAVPPPSPVVSPPQGRLTLTTAVPVLVSTVSAATTIYYTPYVGNRVPIYNGTTFVLTTFTELSNVTTNSAVGSAGPAAVTTNSNYDLFVWSNSGTPTLTRGPAWTSDTGRGTGAGTTQLTRVLGYLTNTVAITNGPGAGLGTYVGTVRSDGSSQINFILGAVAASGTAAVLGVWNAFNRITYEGLVGDSTDSWNYSTATIRPANNSSTMRVSFVQGLQEESFFADYLVQYTNGSQSTLAYGGIGVDSTTAFSGRWAGNSNPVGVGSGVFSTTGSHRAQLLGFHYMQALEQPNSTGTTTWYGDAGGPSQNGLTYRGKF